MVPAFRAPEGDGYSRNNSRNSIGSESDQDPCEGGEDNMSLQQKTTTGPQVNKKKLTRFLKKIEKQGSGQKEWHVQRP